MTDATSTAQPPSNRQGQLPSRNRRRRGGGNSARGQTSTVASQDVLSLRPASIAPQPQQNSAQDADTGNTRHVSSRGRGRGGPSSRGGARSNRRTGVQSSQNAAGGHSGNQTHMAPRRQFGGQLTSDQAPHPDPSEATSLQADAAEFVPGQKNQARPRKPRHPPATHAPKRRERAGSIQKSTAEDIQTRTHEDIASGAYECLICSEPVHRKSKIWTCNTCWAVLHMSCIKRWSSNEAATVSAGRLQDGELSVPRQWRCPGCNLPRDENPSHYTCWCRKETDPTSIPGLPPHSCGQSCGKERTRPRKCPHVCELVCHAGPCPPCTALGPDTSCFCGKNSSQKRCLDTNYDEGWSCGEVCGEPMPCGDPDHLCQRPCHEGFCGACEVPLDARCYCGQVSKVIICNDKGEEHFSQATGDEGSLEQWTGVFQCANVCARGLDCGLHQCERGCHKQGETGSHHCPRSVDMVSTCTCGKTTLGELGIVRQSCEDPVPACEKTCGKQLGCGHRCVEICHIGDCPPCYRKVDIECVCGRTASRSVCHQGYEAKPQCAKLCRTTLNCGRHACEQHCCSGEKRASERMSNKRKHRPLGSAPVREEFESEHICLRVCGRALSCGNADHTCQELCHKGKCNSCPNAIFDEISCHCGRTVLYPPLPCGTKPPPCRSQCQRPSPCSIHPPVEHSCHGDDESCPKCPFLTSKKCMCGKKTLKNQPCFSTNVSCGTACGNLLACGVHFCQKTCHSPGECEDANGRPCGQACGKPKAKCGHPDLAPCHVGSDCKEDRPCQSKMVITCECVRLRVETKCLASKANDGNQSKKLSCDEECARQARNRQLASALNIDPSEHSNDHIPYASESLRLYHDLGKFAAEQEQMFRLFAADGEQRVLRFVPMRKTQRSFLHALATDFGFECESLDPEPHRHVVLFKTPRFVSAPMKTLAECVRIRALQGKLRVPEATSSANASDTDTNLATDERVPYNGFVLGKPRFGLTIDDLQLELAPSLRLAPSLAFDIAFLPNEEVVMRAKPSNKSTKLAPEIVQSGLKGIKPSLSGLVADKNIAGNIGMCVLDSSMNLMRKEQDPSSSAGGWSTVAKGLARQKAPAQGGSTGAGSRFLVLGKKRPEKSSAPKKVEENVVDDWEAEMEREEEAEQKTRVASDLEASGASEGELTV